MSKGKKFYVVRQGRTPGIYTNWDDCKKQVDGFNNAEYKSFEDSREAMTYFTGDNKTESVKSESIERQNVVAIDDARPYAFVDGSFNPDTGVYGYGGFLRFDGQEIVLQGSGENPAMSAMRNVAGEIEGSLAAMKKAYELGLESVDIYYDYAGIEKWATGEWQTKKQETRSYSSAVHDLIDKGLDITFVKVAAHTGIEGNERADKLAKQAVGVVDFVRDMNDKSSQTPVARKLPTVSEKDDDEFDISDFLASGRVKSDTQSRQLSESEQRELDEEIVRRYESYDFDEDFYDCSEHDNEQFC